MMAVRLGIIGAGRIGGGVIAALASLPRYTLEAVLVREMRDEHGYLTDPTAFFAKEFDLILDLAGPDSLRQHGARALNHADVWTIGASALADEAFSASLKSVAHGSGHVLRVPMGAFGGIDGVALVASGKDAKVQVAINRPGSGIVFTGSVRQGALLYPNEANVAVAVALAGLGLERTILDLTDLGPNSDHTLSVAAHSSCGAFTACLTVGHALHPTAAGVIGALRTGAYPLLAW
jgi:aspartate dehydrogenase